MQHSIGQLTQITHFRNRVNASGPRPCTRGSDNRVTRRLQLRLAAEASLHVLFAGAIKSRLAALLPRLYSNGLAQLRWRHRRRAAGNLTFHADTAYAQSWKRVEGVAYAARPFD